MHIQLVKHIFQQIFHRIQLLNITDNTSNIIGITSNPIGILLNATDIICNTNGLHQIQLILY